LGKVVGVVVYCGLSGAVWNVGVSSGGGVVTEGVAGITALHALGRGELELSPSLESESSSLVDSSRIACSDGDQSRPLASGRLKLLERSVMNLRSPMCVVSILSKLDAESKGKLCVADDDAGYIHKGTIKMSRGKA
jgi:hypothetical protein